MAQKTVSRPILPKSDRYASTTLVICSSSYGSALPSTIIWPQSTVPADLFDLRGYNIAIIANSSGWQTKVSFEQMIPSGVKIGTITSLNKIDQLYSSELYHMGDAQPAADFNLLKFVIILIRNVAEK